MACAHASVCRQALRVCCCPMHPRTDAAAPAGWPAAGSSSSRLSGGLQSILTPGVPMIKPMQQRTFIFAHRDAGETKVALLCREPPESQVAKSLTWQIDSGIADQAGRDANGGAAAPAEPPSPAAAAEAAPDLIGLDIWPASIALCRYLAANPEIVAGQEVLELGAGMGLVGLLAAALGAQHVLLTDYEPQVLAHLESNAALNGLQHRCACLRLDWRAPAEGLGPGQRGSWRLICAADVLYASVVVQPFIDTLRLALHPQGVALVGHQVRRAIVLDPATRLPRLEERDEPLDNFKAACRAQGLAVRVLGSRQTCSNVDSDPMVLLAVAWAEEGKEAGEGTQREGEARLAAGEARLARLPPPPGG